MFSMRKWFLLPVMTDKLKLTIVDGTDEPIGNVNVVVENEDSKTTDENGKVEFDLPYGDYAVTVSKDGYGSVTDTLAFRSNHKNFSIVLEMMGTGTVTVTCTDNEDNPLENATVALSTEEYFDSDNPNYDIVLGLNYTDTDGVATLKEIDRYDNPTDVDAEIPFGNYHLFVDYFDINQQKSVLRYKGMLRVNSETVEISIVLQPIPSANVTFTLYNGMSDYDNPTPVTNGYIMVGRDEYQVDENGQVNLELSQKSHGVMYVDTSTAYTFMNNGIVSIEHDVENIDLIIIDPTVTVTLVNENREPMGDGWQVTADKGQGAVYIEDYAQTDENGTATFDNIASSNCYVDFLTSQIEGYEDYKGTFKLTDTNRDFTIQLTPSNSG